MVIWTQFIDQLPVGLSRDSWLKTNVKPFKGFDLLQKIYWPLRRIFFFVVALCKFG